MTRTSDPPPGLIAVPLAKGCVLLLTQAEFLAEICRNKWWRRRVALRQRVTDGISTLVGWRNKGWRVGREGVADLSATTHSRREHEHEFAPTIRLGRIGREAA